jgi:hypothetical protein
MAEDMLADAVASIVVLQCGSGTAGGAMRRSKDTDWSVRYEDDIAASIRHLNDMPTDQSVC